MLERLIIRNFKRFTEVEIELSDVVVLIGPNNSGKTSALQALALWDLGLRRWSEKHAVKGAPRKRTGVAINRRDLVAIPVPEANLFWNSRQVRWSRKELGDSGKALTENIRIEITVHGITEGKRWECGLEFDFANAESIYCRPLGWATARSWQPPPPSWVAFAERVVYLPAMSGLAANETRIDPGAVQVRLGEGRTAEVLRNLCYRLATEAQPQWDQVVKRVEKLFGVTLLLPQYIPERGEIAMSYKEAWGAGVELDLSAAGRGLQQTLLLLAFLALHPGSVLLLDEPDAHLEILRQRQIYHTLSEMARSQRCQLLIASHSEILLNEAAEQDVVVAFVGQPHRIDDRSSQVRKALAAIGFEDYYQAELTGWVLYLEGSTDLEILRVFAASLGHEAAQFLERPFLHYIGNQAKKASEHFFGLREAKPDLAGLVLLDQQDPPLTDTDEKGLRRTCWQRREIENYLAWPEVLTAYAARLANERAAGPLFAAGERDRLVQIMEACIADLIPPKALRDLTDPFWHNRKASDDVLAPIFQQFFDKLNSPNLLQKTAYHVLANLVPKERLDAEIGAKLDLIVAVAKSARPRQ